MKLIRKIIVLMALLRGSAVLGQSLEEISINEVFDNEPLDKVFKTLRKEYRIKMAYDDELIKGIYITDRLEDLSVDQTLQRILDATPLNHLLINNKVIIVPQVESAETDVQPRRYDFNLSGVIRDESTGETLPNAIIRVMGTKKGAVSNMDGFFTILGVPYDTSTISIDYLGYVTKTIKLTPDLDLNNLSFGLQNDVRMLEDVTITDHYNQTLEVTEKVSKVSFNPKSVTSLPSLGELDLFKTMQLMPGISGENESSANLIIRGSLPSQNLVLLDGFTVYHLDHFFGLFSALNPDVVKDVQIYKGGFESKYGGRVAGVVDITGKSGNTKKHTFNLGANLISVRGTLEMPIGEKFNMLISLRRAFTDVVQSGLYNKLFNIVRRNDEQITRPVDDPRFDEIEPDFFFTDFNSKFSFRPSEKDILALSIYAGTDNLSINNLTQIEDAQTSASFQETLNEVTEWGNTGFSMKWGRQWNERHFSNLRLSVASFFKDYNFNYDYRFERPDSIARFDAAFRQDNEIFDTNLAFDNEIIVNDILNIDLGLSFVGHGISYKTFVQDSLVTEDNDEGNISSLYGTAKFKFTPRFSGSIGMRINHHEINQRSYNEPRLSLNYKLTDNINLKGAIGKYHQFVNQIVYDDPYQGNQNFWVFSNDNGLSIVEADDLIAGATFRFGDLLFDIEAYHKNMEGLVELNLIPFFISDELDDLGFLVDGEGRMRGVDMLLQKETGKYKGWISYSLSQSEQSFPEVDGGRFYPSLQDRRHEVKFVNMLQLGNWHLSSSWIYGSGRPFAEFDVEYVTDDQGLVRDFAVTKTNRNTLRLPDYHRLDLSVAYDFRARVYKGQVGLSIFNAYGRKNIKTRKVNIADLQAVLGTPDQPELTYRDLVLVDFTPSVFVNFTF